MFLRWVADDKALVTHNGFLVVALMLPPSLEVSVLGDFPRLLPIAKEGLEEGGTLYGRGDVTYRLALRLHLICSGCSKHEGPCEKIPRAHHPTRVDDVSILLRVVCTPSFTAVPVSNPVGL